MPRRNEFIQTLAVVLLAAGHSRRMGRPKLLLPWNNTSVIGHQIQVWKNLGARHFGLVTAADDNAMAAELDRLNFPPGERVVNSNAQSGMFDSIRCAVQWAGWSDAVTHFAIVLGDQPHLPPQMLEALLDFAGANEDRICQPFCGGHYRHPVILPRTVFCQIKSTGAKTLDEFLKGQSDFRRAFETTEPAFDLDIDTPGDYQRALGMSRSSTRPEPSAWNADGSAQR